jgi:hypothetical protein
MRTVGDLSAGVIGGAWLPWQRARDRCLTCRVRAFCLPVSLSLAASRRFIEDLHLRGTAFSVGPVSFIQREAWLNEIERRRGEPSSWMPAVREVWSGAVSYDDLEDWQAKTVARAVHPDQWVAAVTIDNFDPSESYNRAVLAIRVALDALRLLMPSPHNRKIAAAADYCPPLGLDRLNQVDGHDLTLGSSLNLPGVGGAPGMAVSLINNHQEFLQAAGRRIEVAIAFDPLSLANSCPNLSDRWVNAAHWFGRACGADVDFAALVMLVFSMDVLSGGLQHPGITELLSRLLGIDSNQQVLPDGTTLAKLVSRCWGYRSEIAHGSILAIDKNFGDERTQAEQLARPMLIQYAIELDRYAQRGKTDDRDAFCNSLLQPKASPEKSTTAPAPSHQTRRHRMFAGRKWGAVLGSCLMVLPLAITELLIVGYRGTLEEKRGEIERSRIEYSAKNLNFVLGSIVPEIAMIEFSVMSDRAAQTLTQDKAKEVHNAYLSAMASQLSGVAMSLAEANDPTELDALGTKLASMRDKVASDGGVGEGTGELYGVIAEKLRERGRRLAAIRLKEPNLQDDIDKLEGRIDAMRRGATVLQIIGLLLLLWFEFFNVEVLHPHKTEAGS